MPRRIRGLERYNIILTLRLYETATYARGLGVSAARTVRRFGSRRTRKLTATETRGRDGERRTSTEIDERDAGLRPRPPRLCVGHDDRPL